MNNQNQKGVPGLVPGMLSQHFLGRSAFQVDKQSSLLQIHLEIVGCKRFQQEGQVGDHGGQILQVGYGPVTTEIICEKREESLDPELVGSAVWLNAPEYRG